MISHVAVELSFVISETKKRDFLFPTSLLPYFWFAIVSFCHVRVCPFYLCLSISAKPNQIVTLVCMHYSKANLVRTKPAAWRVNESQAQIHCNTITHTGTHTLIHHVSISISHFLCPSDIDMDYNDEIYKRHKII